MNCCRSHMMKGDIIHLVPYPLVTIKRIEAIPMAHRCAPPYGRNYAIISKYRMQLCLMELSIALSVVMKIKIIINVSLIQNDSSLLQGLDSCFLMYTRCLLFIHQTKQHVEMFTVINLNEIIYVDSILRSVSEIVCGILDVWSDPSSHIS